MGKYNVMWKKRAGLSLNLTDARWQKIFHSLIFSNTKSINLKRFAFKQNISQGRAMAQARPQVSYICTLQTKEAEDNFL
jgi:hypothetical protein